MKKKKLSHIEIEAAVNGIRKKYNDLLVEYMKPRFLRDSFEDRYIEALRARMDMGNFIFAEIVVVSKMLKDEKEKQQRLQIRKYEREHSSKRASDDTRSIADRIFDENRDKIRKYQGVGLDDPDAFEINKLYGALKFFEISYWPVMEKILRRIYPSRYSGPRVGMETRLFEITIPGPDGFPPGLIKLRTILGRSPREYSSLQREIQRCMLDASFLLHDLSEELPTFKNEGVLLKGEDKAVEETIEYVHTVLEDFRLMDLKESRLKEK
ncbi:MAG: hypothetical protein L3J12_03765 [Spirochaetales bacterium]|nr:hypothetical protein [Spirochaetales bacterium]